MNIVRGIGIASKRGEGINRRARTSTEGREHQQKSENINRRVKTSTEQGKHQQKGGNINRRAETSAEQGKHRQKSKNINRYEELQPDIVPTFLRNSQSKLLTHSNRLGKVKREGLLGRNI